MDDLLREFLTETNESLDRVDAELVRFEQDPNNAKILGNIFRLVHTIKGTCGFLGLPRLEALAHAAETLMGKFRDGMPVTTAAVTLILSTIDRIKSILRAIEAQQSEPAGDDDDLIERLNAMARNEEAAPRRDAPVAPAAPRDVIKPPAAREQPEAATPAAARDKPAAERADEERGDRLANQSIRVNVDTLEHLMTMVSELVLTRNQLLEIARRNEDTEFKVPLQRLSNVTAELQEGVMKTRMQPIGNAWQKLPRIVRDLSAELDKQIELEMHGAETELDRQVLDLIKDPLTHMVRNSADHGLETPGRAARRRQAAAGHDPALRLSRRRPHHHRHRRQRPRPQFTERIKAKAIEQRTCHRSRDRAKMTEAQIHKFIFAPGFSTAAQVTSVSGRGVGMDVVRTNIDQIGGTIDVKSVAGDGASFTIKIPLTLAIVSALIVEAGGDRFAIPQLSVVELVRARANSEHRIERIKDTAVLRLRNKLLPLMHLKKLLRLGASRDRQRLHRGHPGRQPDLRHRGRRRVPHRGNRGQADVDQAAAHRRVLRQHHPGRRRGDHDHRSQRHREGARPRHGGHAGRRGPRSKTATKRAPST